MVNASVRAPRNYYSGFRPKHLFRTISLAGQLYYCIFVHGILVQTTPYTTYSGMSTAGSSSSPATRSRTLLFISFRDSRAPSTRFSRLHSSYSDDPYDENETLIHPVSALDSQLPPKWYVSFCISDLPLLNSNKGLIFPTKSRRSWAEHKLKVCSWYSLFAASMTSSPSFLP